MRAAVQVTLAAALVVGGILASTAFSRATQTRDVTVRLVGDASAYLKLAANPSSPHKCFVATTNGVTSIGFASIGATCASQGAGTGLNPGDGATGASHARYAFHDLLLVTNQGTKSVLLWVNATTSSAGSSSVLAAGKTTAGGMTDADYAASLGPYTLATGASLYLGVRVDTGSLAAGSHVFGNLTLTARAG